MHSMKKSLRVGRRSDVQLYLQLDPVNSPTLFRLGLLFPPLGHPTVWMLSQWTLNMMDLHFLLSPVSLQSEHASRHSDHYRNNQKGCVQKPKNIPTKGSTRYGQNIILSRLLQRKMSPLLQLKSLQNLNTRLHLSLNIRTAQIQSSTGRWTCVTSLHNMLRKWKLSGKFWISLIPGRPCLGPLQLC